MGVTVHIRLRVRIVYSSCIKPIESGRYQFYTERKTVRGGLQEREQVENKLYPAVELPRLKPKAGLSGPPRPAKELG